MRIMRGVDGAEKILDDSILITDYSRVYHNRLRVLPPKRTEGIRKVKSDPTLFA